MPTSLRTEAIPLKYAALNAAQRQAMATIVGLLHTAVGQLRQGREAVPASARHFPLDFDRSSRIVMLSGERGTGKTTVLVSIIKACYELLHPSPPSPRQEAEQARAADAMPYELQQELLKVARRTVWLEPIDMEPLPTSTNLLAAVLARVGVVARMARSAPTGDVPAPGRRGLLEREREQDPFVELRRLQAVVATSWEDVPTARRAHLDPQAYAAEVLQAEGDRLSLPEKLDKVLNDLAGLFAEDPLFVLPVDDFDLNPARSLELLRIVRAISVPRLFTMVLGDQRVAEMIVRLGFTGTLAELAGRAAAAGSLAELGADLRTMPAELAGHLVRKLIPPSQVVRLERMTVLEALWYRPPGAAEEQLRLFQLLTQCPLTFEWPALQQRYGNLWAFLFARATSAPEATPPTTRDGLAHAHELAVYAARALFRVAPRRVADLWLGLEQVLRAASDPSDPGAGPARQSSALLALMSRYVRSSVAEDGRLNAENRQALQNAIGLGEDGEGLLDYENLQAEPRVKEGFSVEFDLPWGGAADGRGESSEGPGRGEPAGPAMVVRGRRAVGWALRLDPGGQQREGAPLPRLEEPTTAACMLYHDLLGLGPTGFRRKRSILWRRPDLKQWAATEWRIDDLRTVEVTWLVPGLSTFWEFDLFLGLWNETLTRIRDPELPPEGQLERFLYGWLDTSAAVLGWKPMLGFVTTSEGLNWKPLVLRLEELGSQDLGPQRQKAAREWLAVVACILMPEVIGERPHLSRPFTTPALQEIWVRAAHEIRLYRKGILDRFAGKEMADLAQRFAAKVPDGFPVALIVDEAARLRLRRQTATYNAPSSVPESDPTDRFDRVHQAVVTHGARLRALPGVLDVRAGIKYSNGWSTGQPAVVVSVLAKRPRSNVAPADRLPEELDGVAVDVKLATPQEQFRALRGREIPDGPAEEPLSWAGSSEESAPAQSSAYTPLEPSDLPECDGAMKITCHVSPDSSWILLRQFLEKTRERLAVGMYNSMARYVLESLKRALRGDRTLSFVLDPRPATAPIADSDHFQDVAADMLRDELAQALGQRLAFAWAAVPRPGRTTGGLFPTAYRLGVAVRDGQAVWLSSASWHPIVQLLPEVLHAPAVLPAAYRPLPRAWHLTIEHEGLAAAFERFLQRDLQSAEGYQASAGDRAGPEARPDLLIPVGGAEPQTPSSPRRFEHFEVRATARRTSRPIRVQPLLAPDNYADHVLPLIRAARRSVLFVNTYIHLSIPSNEQFTALVEALREKVNDSSLDVRLILDDAPNTRNMLEALEHASFDMSRIRVQKGVRAQGIIVDNEAVVIGSHRWSSFGLTRDRAASLLIRDRRVAGYFRKVFDNDWTESAQQSVSAERTMPQLAGDAPTPPGMARVPWVAVFGG
jgi:hypothetical protein